MLLGLKFSRPIASAGATWALVPSSKCVAPSPRFDSITYNYHNASQSRTPANQPIGPIKKILVLITGQVLAMA